MKSSSKLYCKSLWASIVTVLLIISAMVPLIAEAEINSTGTYFWVDPTGNIHQAAGSNFTINIKIVGAPQTYAWSLKLAFDNATLSVVAPGATEGTWLNSVNTNTTFYATSPATANSQGWIAIGCTFYGSVSTGASDSGTLCTVKFHVKSSGTSALDLQNTVLLDMNLVRTEYPNNDGFFASTTTTVHDIEITGVVANKTSPVPNGTIVGFTVTVHNGGNSSESGTVTAKAVPTDTREPNITIDGAQPFGPLAVGASTTVTLAWNTATAGQVYNIVSTATITGFTDNDPHDNVYIGPVFRVIQPHNIKVAGVKILDPPNVKVHVGHPANVSVTVYNEGNNSETFDAYVYAGSNVTKVPFGSLAINGTKTLFAVWYPQTTGTFGVKANVSALSGETDTADNQMNATGTLTVINFDVVILSVGASSPVGFNINVTVKNAGTVFARFTVYVWAVNASEAGSFNMTRALAGKPPTTHSYWIGWIPIISLSAGDNLTFTCLDPYIGLPCGGTTPTLYPPYTPLTVGASYYIYAVTMNMSDTDDNPSNNYRGTAFAVRATLPGDVDGNGKVTWEDLSALGLAYGTDSTKTLWNVRCDFDANGKITWEDLSTLGLDYGLRI